MSNDLKKTLAFAAVAGALVAVAFVTTRPRDLTAEEFTRDQGQPFFADFTDPRAATALEVIDFNADTAEARPFKVEYRKDDGWVIPSHNDYPADGKDRLAKTAAGVIDLKKDVIVSNDTDMHEELGVIDPLDTKSTALKGRGKRVTLKDASGKVLADLIIGNAVRDKTNQRYVRLPGQKVTYGVNMNVDLSARFADWIETNLLKLDAFHLLNITYDKPIIDHDRGTVAKGDVIELTRKDGSSPWTINQVPAGKELDTSKVSSITTALADIKIVGVRPKPGALAAVLKGLAEGNPQTLSRPDKISLASRGFFLLPDGTFVSNGADLYASTDEGLVYHLHFGEVTFATGEELSAGSTEDGEEAEGEAKKKEEEKSAGATESRYLFAMVDFRPELVPKPELLKQADASTGELPAHVFARTESEIKADADKLAQEKTAYEKKLEDGKKKAKELSDRFADWYYVVPGDAYRNVVVDRANLVRDPNAPATTPSTPPGGSPFPGGLNIPGLPPGH